MKSRLILKGAILLVSLLATYGVYQQNAVANDGCATNLDCHRSSKGACYCTHTSCSGCFIPTNDTSCGRCSKGGDMEIQ
jgi:hypothetical protein